MMPVIGGWTNGARNWVTLKKLGVDVEEALASLSGPNTALIAAAIVLAALALSVLASLSIYRHKEF